MHVTRSYTIEASEQERYLLERAATWLREAKPFPLNDDEKAILDDVITRLRQTREV